MPTPCRAARTAYWRLGGVDSGHSLRMTQCWLSGTWGNERRWNPAYLVAGCGVLQGSILVICCTYGYGLQEHPLLWIVYTFSTPEERAPKRCEGRRRCRPCGGRHWLSGGSSRQTIALPIYAQARGAAVCTRTPVSYACIYCCRAWATCF